MNIVTQAAWKTNRYMIHSLIAINRCLFATLLCNDALIFTFSPQSDFIPPCHANNGCFDKECNATIGDGGTVPLTSIIKSEVPRFVKIYNVALP